MNDKFRRDGTPYPEGKDGLYEWAKDFEDPNKKIVKQDKIGKWFISTVWLGLDHSWGTGDPLIFETMVFDKSIQKMYKIGTKHFINTLGEEVEMIRYSTEQDAIKGHKKFVSKYKKKCLTINSSERNIKT